MRRTLLAAIAAVAFAGPAFAWTPLVAPADLAEMDDVAILDIRSPADFAAGHVEGAVNVPYPNWRGPAENPGKLIDDAALTELLRGAGLDGSERVVVTYAGEDETDFGAAARVYWTLKSAGFEEIAILNGGLAEWTAAGEPVALDAAEVEPSDATFALSERWLIDADGVAAVQDGRIDATLIDARPHAFFAGDAKHPAAGVAGTLQSATNLPFTAWFGASSAKIADPAEAAAIAEKAAAEAPDGELVSFCNTGHWAATNWFALSELAGKEDVRLYPESVVGWLAGGGEVVAGN